MEQLRRFVLFLVLGLALGGPALAQVLVNYDQDIAIDEGGDWRFVPEIARVTIDLAEFPMAELAIEVPGGSALFFGEVMWMYAEKDSSFVVPLHEIRQAFPHAFPVGELVIYKKGIQAGDVGVQKGLFSGKPQGESIPEVVSVGSQRIKSPAGQFFFVMVFTVFFLVALFKMIYPTVLSFIIHPMLVFSTEDFSESGSTNKFFTEEVLFFLVIFNMLLMGVIMISAFYLEVPILEGLTDGDLNQSFLIWLLGSGILMLISLLKFLWLKVSALIFDISKIEFIHFFYMLRVAALILIGTYVVLILCFANDISPLTSIIRYLLQGFFVLYILGAFILFFMMVTRVSLKNYHLFSYLCTAELVPFLVLSKLIIG